MEEDIIEKCKKSRLPEGEDYIFGKEAILTSDISILEYAIKCNKKQFEELGTHILLQDDEMRALENLIKGYREKEESEKYLYEAYQDTGKKMFEYSEQLENSIPKSLIKEKIEELNKEEQEAQNSISDEEREEYSDANISYILMDIETRRRCYKELLGEEK